MDVFGRIVRRQPHGGQRIGDGIAAGAALGRVGQQVERFGDQPVHAVARVEAAEGVLEHHLHFAPHGKIGFAAAIDRCTVECDAARLHRFQTQKRPCQGRFPAAAFTDEAKAFPPLQGEGHVIDGAEPTRFAEQRLARQGIIAAHVFHLQQRLRRRGGRQGDRMGRGGKQHPRIGVAHGVQQGVCVPLFDDLSLAHDDDAVGHIGDHRQIMGDYQQPHPVIPRQRFQQIKDLRLGRDIQRGGRFIGDQQARPQRDRHRDHHPLALPARQLVRVAGQGKAVIWQADPLKRLGGLAGRGVT